MCTDVQKFQKLNNLSTNIIALKSYQAQNKWKHSLIRIEISKNGSNSVDDLLINKNPCYF